MTLIAAFKNRGIPLLLGDFLLTNRQRSVSGLRKKVHVMGPNVAIGWAGFRVTASSVLKDLYTLTKGNRLSRRELEVFLKNYPKRELNKEVHLVGWIVEKSPKCFLWNSIAPDHVHWDHTIIDGSGERTFEKILASAGGWGATHTSPSTLDAAIKYSLFVSSHLMSDEVLGKKNQKLGFGHAYEILYYDGSKFRPVNNVIYSIFDLKMKPSFTSYKPDLYTFFRYFTLDNNSIIEHCRLDSNERRFDLVTPVFEQAGSEPYSIESSGIAKHLDFTSSDYYLCALARFISPTNKISIFPFLIPPNTANPSAFIKTIGKRTEFAVNLDYLLKTYNKMVNLGQPDNLDLALRHVGPGAFRELTKVLKEPSPGTITLRWRMGRKSDDIMLVDLVGGVFQNRISVLVRKNKSIQLRVFDGLGQKMQITSKPYDSSQVLHIAVTWDSQCVSLWIQGTRIGRRQLFKTFNSNWLSLLIGIDIEGELSAQKVNRGYTIEGITGLNLEKSRKLKGSRLTDIALFSKVLTQERIEKHATSSDEDVISKKKLSH